MFFSLMVVTSFTDLSPIDVFYLAEIEEVLFIHHFRGKIMFMNL